MIHTLFTTLAFVGSVTAAIGHVTSLHITNKFITPDGFNRSAVLADGVFPGPLIHRQKGERFKINVIDDLTDGTMSESTSIHWHGLFQAGTAWADGTAFVTQCPIVPGESFLYDFEAPGQAGTYWYHSHVSTQSCDGLKGPLVIYDPDDPFLPLYDVDDENTVITLSDWYHTVAPQQHGVVITPDSTLINGLGRHNTTPNGPLSVVNVKQGMRYRFRLLSLSCHPYFVFSIDSHTFTVIEADGVNTKPIVADSLKIFTGQRYSVIVEANQTVDNYWIRGGPNVGTTGFTDGINSAILRYEGAPDSDPVTEDTAKDLLLETSLVPFENPGAPGKNTSDGADLSLNLVFALNSTTQEFTVNGAVFVPPSVPVLLQILSGNISPKDLLPSGSIYKLPLNSVIQIAMPGIAGNPHPFHLHGHNFDVIRSAGADHYNYVNPPRRDVVSMGTIGDNVTIRFKTDNPGPWFLHCHIDWHLQLGLAVVFVEDGVDIAKKNPVPNTWKDLCPIYNAEQ